MGLVAIDAVKKDAMLGATAKAQVTAIGRTRVGFTVVGLGSTDGLTQPREDIRSASRIGFGALISQSLYLARRLEGSNRRLRVECHLSIQPPLRLLSALNNRRLTLSRCRRWSSVRSVLVSAEVAIASSGESIS